MTSTQTALPPTGAEIEASTAPEPHLPALPPWTNRPTSRVLADCDGERRGIWAEATDTDSDIRPRDKRVSSSKPSLVAWEALGHSDRARSGRGRFAGTSDRPDHSSLRERSLRRGASRADKATTETELRLHFAAERASSAKPGGSGGRRDSSRPSSVRGSSTRDSGPVDMDVDTNAAAASARPTAAAHSRGRPSDPSASSPAPRKQHDFHGSQRLITIGQQTIVAPSRLDLAADLKAKRRKNRKLDIIEEAQFCFYPKRQPRYYNPGSRCFCMVYNKPGGDSCSRDHFDDPEFPGISMCGGTTTGGVEEIRVHGCTWCGEVGHPASRCWGPYLAAADIQMTLVEFNKWDKNPKRDWWTARNMEEMVHRTRDPDGRFRNAVPPGQRAASSSN